MKILQRYILSDLLGPTIMSVLMLTFVLLATQLFRLTDYLINRGVSLYLFGQFLGALLPQIFMLTLPMGLLVAVLLTFGRLSADREIMAMRTSGVNIFTLYWPVAVMALLMTGLLFYFTNELVPQRKLGLTNLRSEVAYMLQSSIGPGEWHSPDTAGDDRVNLMFMERGEHGEMSRVQMHLITTEGTEAARREQVIILGRSGRLTPLRDADALSFDLQRGSLHIFNPYEPTGYTIVRFDRLERDIRLETDTVIKRGLRDDEMTTPRLLERIDALASAERVDVTRLNQARTEYWQRLSMPFAAVAFVLMGMPLGLMGRTAGKAVGFTVAFLLIFAYYVMLKWGTSLGIAGHPWAIYAIFSPNVVMAALGAFLIDRTVRA